MSYPQFRLVEVKSAENIKRGDYLKIGDSIVRANTVFKDSFNVYVRGSNAMWETFMNLHSSVNVYQKSL